NNDDEVWPLLHPSLSGRRLCLRPGHLFSISWVQGKLDLLSRSSLRIFTRHISKDSGKDHVASHIVENDLVISIEVGMPGVIPVIPAQGTQAEGRCSSRHKRSVIRSSSCWHARKTGLNMSGN